MSIVTRTGDNGTTGLMYNRRVSKTDARVEAYGCVDELNAALGMARATARHAFVRSSLFNIQKDLVAVMGELATTAEDFPRYVKDGYSVITKEMTAKLEKVVTEIESQKVSFKGWATPGSTVNSAALHMARTICRRAERRVCGLHEAGQHQNPETIIFLNRLSDTLWLLAQWVETKSRPKARAARE
jgi:cob(I)alamin adenosyltransferase